jgi:hypothetical protein
MVFSWGFERLIWKYHPEIRRKGLKKGGSPGPNSQAKWELGTIWTQVYKIGTGTQACLVFMQFLCLRRQMARGVSWNMTRSPFAKPLPGNDRWSTVLMALNSWAKLTSLNKLRNKNRGKLLTWRTSLSLHYHPSSFPLKISFFAYLTIMYKMRELCGSGCIVLNCAAQAASVM